MGKTRDQGNLVTDGRPILGSNEIGIGTDNPLASLDVRGNMLVDNISVAGTITYDDVTSVDSIGIVTARSGVDITGGELKLPTVTGDNNNAYQSVLFQTATGAIQGGSGLSYNPGQDALTVNGNVITSTGVNASGAGPLKLSTANYSSTTYVKVSDKVEIEGNVGLGTDNPTSKLEIIGGDVNLKSKVTTTGIPTSYTGSVDFNGGDDDYLTVDSGADFAFGTGDFTIECFVYQNTQGSYDYLIDGRNGSQTTGTWSLSHGYGSGTTLQFGTGSSALLTCPSGSQPGTNKWYHVAVSRSGTSLKMFIDGVQVDGATNSTNFSTSPTISYIGTRYSTEHSLDGHISNLRVIKGTALYTSNFTPQTAELTQVYNTTLLACQSSSSVTAEATGKTITANGNVAASTTNPSLEKGFDTSGSVYLDGTGDYLSIADSADLEFGSSDFTIEGWYYPVGENNASKALFNKRGSGNGGPLLYFDYNNNLTPRLLVYIGSNWNVDITSSITFTSSAWNHFAVVRNGSTFELFINGKSGGTDTNSGSIPDNSNPFVIGAMFGNGNNPIDECYISNFRIVNGTALYTSDFSPTFTELTNLPNTKFLALQSSSSATAYAVSPGAITANGNAAASSTSPGLISPHSITGSVEFDGNGDYLSIADSTDFDLGLSSDPFTIEMWVYPRTIPSGNLTILGRGGGTGGWNSTNGHQYLLFIYDNQFYFQRWTGSSLVSVNSSSGDTLTLNKWTHLAVSYDGTDLKVYRDGAQFLISTNATFGKPSSSNITRIGTAPASGGSSWDGFISNVRIVKGTALYTTAFTPSREELDSITNTKFLALQSSSSATTEVIGKTITANGNAAASTTSPGLVKAYTSAGGQTTTTTPGNLFVSGKVNIGVTTSGDDVNIVGSDVGARLALIRNAGGNANDGDLLGAISFQSYANGQDHTSAETAIKSYAETGQSGSSAPSDLRFFTKPSNVGPGGSGYERLRINSSGRVMLNTPTEGNENADEFTISFNNEGVVPGDQGRCGMTIRSGSNTSNVEQHGYIYFSNGTSGDNEYKGTIVYEHSTDALKFGTNGGVEKLRIDSSGNIRIPFIGNGTGLRQKIQFVTESNFFDEVAYIAMDRTAVSMAPTDMVFATGQVNSVSERLRIDSTGNVTLGYAGNSLYFQNGSNNRASRIQNGGASGSANLKFYINNAGTETERLRIESDGDVNVIGGNLSVGLDTSTLDFTDSNNYTRFVEVGADGNNNGDALFVAHSSGSGVGYFGYESGNDRLVVACDNGGGNNKIDFIINAGTTTGGATDNLNSATPAMRIDANGVVRINETAAITASATPRLFVRTASSTSTTDIVAKFGNNNTTTSSESVIAVSAGYLLSNTDTEGHVQFGAQRSGNGNRAGFIVKTWDGGSNFNRHLRVDYLGGTNIMRSNYGGTHDSGNTGDNWWKVGEFRDISMGWRGHLTLMGAQSYSAGANTSGDTTINLCIVNNNTVTGHFYGHSGQTGTVKGVATKYDATTDILEVWVQPSNSYAGFGVIPNASYGGWYAASTNTGSNALPSGASSLPSHVYFQTEGTNALVINSNQQITTPAQPSFRAGRSGSYTPGAQTDIIFNSVHHNVGSHYDSSNGRFTVPVAGTYIFTAHVIWQSVSNGQAMDDCFYISVNGAEVGYSGRRAEFVEGTTGNAAYFTDFNTFILNLSANDYVTIENRFAGLQVHGNVNYTTFAGYLLG